MSGYIEPYVTEIRDDGEELMYDQRDRDRSDRKRGNASTTTSNASQSQSAGLGDVSPEVIARLKEEIKSEIIEDFRRASIATPAFTQSKSSQHSRQQSSSASSPPAPAPATILRDETFTAPSQTYNHVRRPSSPSSWATKPAKEFDSYRVDGADCMPTSRKARPKSMHGGADNARMRTDMEESDPGPRLTLNKTFSTADLSILDQKWGALFDQDMEPTTRLGQVWRGVANYIIYEFEPKGSIVISPSKMQAFYARYPLEQEPHPFIDIFRSNCFASLSELYRQLHCEHHLISCRGADMLPSVPALTSNGFANWTTLLTLSYPDLEHARLNRIVAELPVDACGSLVDGKPERLPKQLSRHLLPNHGNSRRREEIREAVKSFMQDASLLQRRPRDGAYTPPRTGAAELPQEDMAPIETIGGKRMSYVRQSSDGESAIDDDPVTIDIQHERERQPYTAMPGNGRIYADDSPRNSAPSPRFNPAEKIFTQYMRADGDERTIPREHISDSRSKPSYRSPSPPKASVSARSSISTNLNNSGAEREGRSGRGTTFAIPNHTNRSRERERLNSFTAGSTREREREDLRNRERERDRVKEKVRKEKTSTTRPRRDTLDSNSRSDSSAQSGGQYDREDRSKRDDYRYPRH